MIDVLPLSYYLSTDVIHIAQDLLGKIIHTHFDGHYTSGRIVETEAYRAPDDKACHAFGNKRTARTEIMFQEGGRAYIYLCYGIHHLFNVVTAKEDEAHAVLIRAIEPLDGLGIMMERRNMNKPIPRLTAGPGSLSSALGLKSEMTGTTLLDPKSAIFISQGSGIPKSKIIASPRVGVSYSEECALWNWRFRIKHSKWTSQVK